MAVESLAGDNQKFVCTELLKDAEWFFSGYSTTDSMNFSGSVYTVL